MALMWAGTAASAQLIPVKTIPVAESEQFSFFPTAGRTGMSMVLTDSLLDPFSNPAKGALVRSHYFGAPSFFAVSNNSGGGTTFPMGGLFKRGPMFGGFAAAFQQIDRPPDNQGPFFPIGVAIAPPPPGSSTFLPGFEEPQPRSQSNNYAFAMLGHSQDSARTSIAASVLWSGLKSVDGVDQFYSGNQTLKQLGDAVDMRLGVMRSLGGGRTLEAMLLRNRFAMSHDVGFMEFVWDPASRTAQPRARRETNSDRTSVWGLHLEYEQPLDSGWRIGALATTNLIEHPRIPNYEITAGRGTQGRSTAFNFGAGIGRAMKDFAFGVDVIYEPIVHNSSAPDTVDNYFLFHNAKVRGGLSRDFALLTPGNFVRMQFSSEYHWINYSLEQTDHVSSLFRRQHERWLERGRSGGISFVTPTLQMHYMVSSKTGVGRPGVISNDQIFAGVDVLSIAPWRPDLAPATLGAVTVTRHQFSISVPVR